MNNIAKAFTQTLSLWRVVLPAMLIGCLAGNWLQGTRLWQKCSRLMAPFARLARLPTECGVYLAMCFLNHHSANAFLSTQFRKGRLRERELLAAYLIGWLPSGLHFAIFYIAPILIAAVGWRPGGLYMLFYLLISFMIAISGLLIGFSVTRKKSNLEKNVFAAPAPFFSKKRELKRDLQASIRQFGRIALIFAPITLLFAIALNLEQTTALIGSFDTLLRRVGLSAPSVLVIIAGFPSSISAIAAAGSLFRQNLLDPNELIVSLLVAYALHTIYEFMTSNLPSNIAFFGATRGVRVTLFYLLIRLLSICLVLGFAIFYLI